MAEALIDGLESEWIFDSIFMLIFAPIFALMNT